LLNKPVLLVNL
jgi:hypothetical protein